MILACSRLFNPSLNSSVDIDGTTYGYSGPKALLDDDGNIIYMVYGDTDGDGTPDDCFRATNH